MSRWRKTAVAVALMAAAVGLAHAGRTCEPRAPTPAGVQRALDLAVRTARALDATGADVVLLARAGQDLSQHRLQWSHLGLAYRDVDAKGVAVWRVVHKLNRCGSAQADVWRQGLGEFFFDDVFEHRAAIALLAPEVQARLKPLLQDDRRAALLHTPAYSMVAYPWAQTYQQSNQWAIETLALSQEQAAATRGRAQAWLRLKGYEPTVLHISPLTRLGARATSAHIAFDDHPPEKRWSNRIETVTADSVLDWLQRSGLATGVQVLR